MLNIKDLRREYHAKEVDLKDLNQDPFIQFEIWFQDAFEGQILEPNAMILATASLQAKPSSRTVLLKGMDQRGFIFFTNYESRKAHELAENPYASVTFPWLKIERQVIIEGSVEKLSLEESTTYFATRPRTSQLGTWASHQDQVIPSRDILEQEFVRLEKEFKDKKIPLPPYWGGYRILPTMFEFHQGRANRLHDRFQYTLKDHYWQIARLSP